MGKVLNLEIAAAKRYAASAEERKKALRQADRYGVLTVETADRIEQRRQLLHESDYSSIAFERAIGEIDFLPVSFLEQGHLRARSVGLLETIVQPSRNVTSKGTGFLVSPVLMLTNNHVLPTKKAAEKSTFQLNFEFNTSGRTKSIYAFYLEPSTFFYTNRDLDFTLVAVEQHTVDGKPLADFGYIQLVGESGKAFLKEAVSSIQHPKGLSKQVVLRDSRILDYRDSFVHYSTDTERGSSGSPIFNDQWHVVALHHTGVPDINADGLYRLKDGTYTDDPSAHEDELVWIANEGIRISSIYDHIRTRPGWTANEKQLLSDVFDEMEFKSRRASDIAAQESQPSKKNRRAGKSQTRPLSYYKGRPGYDPEFLGIRVSLPTLTKDVQADAAPLKDGSGIELKYQHFSVVISKSRRTAKFAAVNIDGRKEVDIPRGKDSWYYDPRIDLRYQSGEELYAGNALDRGHLVRRKDPDWGTRETAQLADTDTFHFTNASAQHKDLNQKTWLDLEDYILNNTNTRDLKVVVFTGPVFRDDDRVYRRQFRLPQEFWKVVVMVKQDGSLSATAYLQTQRDLLITVETEFTFGPYKTYQVPISRIERLTGLRFGTLKQFDPISHQESITANVMRVTELDEIRL